MNNVWAPSEHYNLGMQRNMMPSNTPMMMGHSMIDMTMLPGNMMINNYPNKPALLPTPFGRNMSQQNDYVQQQQIGPQIPPGVMLGGSPDGSNTNDNMDLCNDEGDANDEAPKFKERNDKDKRLSQNGSKGQIDRHQRSRSRDCNDRSRNDRDRERKRRDRKSKWDSNNDNMPQGTNNVIPANENSNMMNYNNMYSKPIMQQSIMENVMMQQPLAMEQPMTNMNMQQMGNMMMPTMVNTGIMEKNIGNQMFQPMNAEIVPNKPIYLTNAVLMPPPSYLVPDLRREKPVGCKTIFISGLPNIIREDTLREIFERFGMVVDIRLNRKGFCHLRFDNPESVEAAFVLTGYRFKYQDMHDSQAVNICIDYALNRDDQVDYERKCKNPDVQVRVHTYSQVTLEIIMEKIKSEDKFAEAAPTLAHWLEKGECNKRNANAFYSMIQSSNNQVRRLLNEKMCLDDELQNTKAAIKDRFQAIVRQSGVIAKILTAAKLQRVWDHFTKQQRRNIEMWQKMTEELENIKEEFALLFEEDENDHKPNRKMVPEEKYEELKRENENLAYELEGYKNEAYLAKEEAETMFEKFKAQYIAQQALQGTPGTYMPLAPPPPPPPLPITEDKPVPPPPLPDDPPSDSYRSLASTEAKLISVIATFLLIHPRGTHVDNIAAYARSVVGGTSGATVVQVLTNFPEIFEKKVFGYGERDEKWFYKMYDDGKSV